MTPTAARMSRLLPLAAALALTAGCTAGTPAAIAKLAPGLVDAALQAALGQLLPPPRLRNDNLVPIFVKALAGKEVDASEVGKVLALCDGVLTKQLPETSGFDEMDITTTSTTSAFGLLGDDVLTVDGPEVNTRVGLGAASPAEARETAQANPKWIAEAPFFAALKKSNGHYQVEAAPDVVDLRPEMPPVRNQGRRPTCMIFAACGVMDHLYANTDLPIKTASPQFLEWLYKIEIKAKVPKMQAQAFTDSGTSPLLFYYLLHIDGNSEVTSTTPYVPPQQGYLSEDQCPYQATKVTNPSDIDPAQDARQELGDALEAKIAGGQAFASQGAYFFRVKMDAPSFEAAIAGHQPIQITLPLVKGVWPKPGPGGRIPEPTKAQIADKANIGYHSVVLVGYERDSSAPGGGYFIVRNSWGDRWGDHGHAHIPYNYALKYGSSAHIATAYAKPFDAQYAVTPPPKDAPPEDQVLANRPLPPPDQVGKDGGYTNDDVQVGQSLDELFGQLLADLEQAFGVQISL